MSRAALLVVLAACGAQVDGGNGTVDGPSADAPPDAPPPSDTPRACAGGDAAMTAPDGSCFLLFTTPTAYGDAQASCASLTAHLAFLKTAELDTAAEVFVGTNDTFIGFSDQATEGTFVWDDGSPRLFDNFAATEPNSGGGSYEEDCVLIAGVRATKQWDDRPCDPAALPGFGLYAYLCQFP